jgi:small nuclear ribonucleoprotein (snRNP)-like protein
MHCALLYLIQFTLFLLCFCCVVDRLCVQLPLSLLRAAQDRPMLVELKNGDTYNGHLVNCDTWMNINLRDVICTSRVRGLQLIWLCGICMSFLCSFSFLMSYHHVWFVCSVVGVIG